MTGSIDKTVAQYWKEDYDIRYKLEQEFFESTHGPYYGGYVATFPSLRRTGNISDEDLLVEMAEYVKPRVSDERLQSPAWHRPGRVRAFLARPGRLDSWTTHPCAYGCIIRPHTPMVLGEIGNV